LVSSTVSPRNKLDLGRVQLLWVFRVVVRDFGRRGRAGSHAIGRKELEMKGKIEKRKRGEKWISGP
jgi:hypothetical protein